MLKQMRELVQGLLARAAPSRLDAWRTVLALDSGSYTKQIGQLATRLDVVHTELKVWLGCLCTPFCCACTIMCHHVCHVLLSSCCTTPHVPQEVGYDAMQFMTHKSLLVSIEMEAVLSNGAAHVLAIEAPPEDDEAARPAPTLNGLNGNHDPGEEHVLLNGAHQPGHEPKDGAALLPATKPPMSTTSSAKERAGWAQYSWLARFQSKKSSFAGRHDW